MNVAWTQRRKILACSIVAALSLPAAAAEKTWVSNASGAWSTSANWLDGIAPPAGGDAALDLRFAPGGNGDVIAANDLGEFLLHGLRFDRNGSGLLTLSGNRLRLAGASPVIEIAGSGHTTISAETLLDPGSGDVTITGTGAGNLTTSGAITQTGTRSLVIAAQPPSAMTQVITLSGANTFSGGLTLQSGNLALTSSASAGTGPMVVNGGTLRFIGSSPVTFSKSISLNSDLNVVESIGTIGVTLSGVISSATPGTGLTYRPERNPGAATLTLSGAATYTGATRVDFGAVTGGGFLSPSGIRLSGSALNSSLFDIRAGGTLQIDGSNTAVTSNRISDSTPVELHSAILNYVPGLGTAAQTETIGPLRVSGYSVVSVLPTTTTNPRLTADSLARLERGTVLIRGRSLGSPFAVNIANMLFTNAPTLVGAGGTGLQTSIVPHAIGSISGGGFGSGFVTYSPTTGVRLLAAGEFAANLPSGITTQNVQLSSSLGSVNTPRTINSLALLGASVSGSGALTITSGAVLSTTTNGTLGNPLNFDTREGIVFSVGALTISGAISGSGGLTKSGDEMLTLTAAANPFTGQLTVNSGQLAFNAIAQLGASATPIVLDGQGAGLTYTGAGSQLLSRGFTIASGVASHRATGGGTLELSGTITGLGGLSVGAFNGSTIALTGINSSSGPILFTGTGRIAFSGDAALGSGSLNLNGGIAQPLASWNTSRTIHMGGGATIDTAGLDARWSGMLSGLGNLTKAGVGTLTIAGSGPYGGALTVSGGTLRFDNPAPLHSTTFTVNAGARLSIDKVASASSDQVGDLALIRLNEGDLAFSGNATADASETLGSIEIPATSTGGTVTLFAGGGFGATLRAGSLAPLGSDLVIRGEQLGGSAGSAYTRLVVAAPLASVGGILRDVYAQELLPAGPLNFAVYDTATDAHGVIGLRAVRPGEQTAGAEIRNPANGGTTPVSTNFVAGAGTTALGAENTIHTLTLEDGGSLSLGGGQKLALTAAALLVRPGASGATTTGGILDFGAVPGKIAAFGDLTIGSTLGGSGGWSKTGAGTLTLLGAPTSPGTAVIQQGVLRAGGSGVLAATSLDLRANTALELNGFATTLGNLSGSGEVRLGASPLTLGALGEDLAFSGRFTGSGPLIITGGANPSALRTLTSSTALTGGLTLDSGYLVVTATNPFSSGAITIDGGALHMAESVGMGAGFALNSDLRVRGAGTLTLLPAASVGGAGSISLEDSGSLSIQTATSHTGATVIPFGRGAQPSATPGTITLGGATGSLGATSAIRIEPGGSLLISSSGVFAGLAGGRIPDNAPVFLHSSSLQFTVASTIPPSDNSEIAGPLHAGGYSTVTVSVNTLVGGLLKFASLQREDRGTLLFRAPNLGSPLANGVGQIQFTSTPAGDLVGAGGSGPDVSVLPYAVGDTGTSGSGTGFVTYENATGIRLLNLVTEYSQSLAAALPTNNVRLNASSILDTAQTINALVLNASLSGAGTLSITSGALLSPGSFNTISANLAFGAREANLFVVSSPSGLTIAGGMSGSGGLTKSGTSPLVISGSNQITGPLTINAGSIQFTTLAQLGNDSSPVRISGGALTFAGSGTLAFSRGIEVSSGFASLGNSNTAATFDVSGVISGEGGVRIFGSGFVSLSAVNTYRGPTVVSAGLAFTADTALGEDGPVELAFSAAKIRLDGDWTTSRRLVVSATSSLLLNGHDAVVSGPIEGSATLSVTGPGILDLEGRSSHTGSLVINGGVTLNGDAELRSNVTIFGALAPGNGVGGMSMGNLLFGSSSKLALEIASPISYDRIALAGTLTIGGATDLLLAVLYDPADGIDRFTIIDNEGIDPVSFTGNSRFVFEGTPLNEGQRFTAGGQEFQISYTGGDGNDVVLAATPEPGSLALLACGGLLCLRRRR